MQPDLHKYLKIGQLAEICSVSVQTLRYYGKIGILNPDYKDEVNSYRYYSRSAISRISNIKLLQSSGFSLKDIRTILEEDSLAAMISRYSERRNAIERELSRLENQHSRISGYLGFFESMREGQAETIQDEMFKPRITECAARVIISLREETLYDYMSTTMLYNRLLDKVSKQRCRTTYPLLTIFHDDYTDLYHKITDLELGLEIAPDNPAGSVSDERISRTITAGWYVECLHEGKYPSSISTYGKMKLYADQQGWKQTGPVMHSLIVPIFNQTPGQQTIFKLSFALERK